jgi:hypothetical protein
MKRTPPTLSLWLLAIFIAACMPGAAQTVTGAVRGTITDPSCIVPAFDGAYFSEREKEALWARFYTGAPLRQRRCVERYNIVKRA